MFEYQTAISELTGLPVSNASTYEGPSAVAAAAYLAKLHNAKRSARRQRRPAPAHAADAAHARARLRHGRRRGAAARRRHRPRRRGPRRSTATPARRSSPQPNFYGAVEDAAALQRRRQGAPASPVVIAQADPIALGVLAPPGDCGVDVARRRGPAAGQPPGLRRAVVRLLRRARGVPAAHARAHRRRDRRRRRPPRLRAHAADARAAHPPREGDLEHLHRAGAQRARRRRLPGLAGAPRHRRARRAAARAHALRARDARRAARRRTSCTSSRSCASSRCASTPTSPRCAGAAWPTASTPASTCTRSAAASEDRGVLLVALTEKRSRADIDRLADVLGAAVAAERDGGDGRAGPRRWRRERDRRQPPARRPGHRRPPPAPPARRVAAQPARCSASARRRSSRRARRAGARSSARRWTCPQPDAESCCPRAFAARSRRACPRSQSRRSCATTSASPSATSTWTRASTRSARAR